MGKLEDDSVEWSLQEMRFELDMHLRRIAYAIERLVQKETMRACGKCGCTLMEESGCPVCDT